MDNTESLEGNTVQKKRKIRYLLDKDTEEKTDKQDKNNKALNSFASLPNQWDRLKKKPTRLHISS